MADYPKTPVMPLGPKVRARTAGWEDIQADDYVPSFEEGLDVLPAGEGVPEWVEGELEGFEVTGTSPAYFKHIVDGYDVDPDSIEEVSAVTASLMPHRDVVKFADIDRDLRTKLHVSANDAMHRALSSAGAKIRTRMSRTASGRQWLDDHPCANGVLARVAPPALVAAAGLTEQMLIEQAFADFQGLWSEYLEHADLSLIRQMAKVLDVDINTMSAQAEYLKQGADEGWVFLERSLTNLANGYLGDSATVVATDEVVTTNLVDMGDIRKAIGHASGAGTLDPKSAGVAVGDNLVS